MDSFLIKTDLQYMHLRKGIRKMTTTMFGLEHDKYPSRMGKAWTSGEETQLLESIKQNTQIKQVAMQHERTPGGITSRLRHIAYKLYINNISLENIQTITGLTCEVIADAIKRREDAQKRNERKKENTTRKKLDRGNPSKTEIVNLLSDIQTKMTRLNILVTMMN
jgi:hypothetical protein